jgi:hypothetical protein
VVVSKKVLQLILQKHTTFNEEFARLEQDSISMPSLQFHFSCATLSTEVIILFFYCGLTNTLYVYCQILFLLKTFSKYKFCRICEVTCDCH